MAQRMSTQHLQRLKTELDLVEDQIRLLMGKRDGLNAAIAIISDDSSTVSPQRASGIQKASVKNTVLRIAIAHAEEGVVATDILRYAEAEGINLDRNSVSSLLSKFKKDGVLVYDGEVYRPSQPALREVKPAA